MPCLDQGSQRHQEGNSSAKWHKKVKKCIFWASFWRSIFLHLYLDCVSLVRTRQNKKYFVYSNSNIFVCAGYLFFAGSECLIFTESATRLIQSISRNVRDKGTCPPGPVTPKRKGIETSSRRGSSLNSPNKKWQNIFFTLSITKPPTAALLKYWDFHSSWRCIEWWSGDRWHVTWDMWQVTHDAWQVTHDKWYVTHDTCFCDWGLYGVDFLVSVLLPTNVESHCLPYAGLFSCILYVLKYIFFFSFFLSFFS